MRFSFPRKSHALSPIERGGLGTLPKFGQFGTKKEKETLMPNPNPHKARRAKKAKRNLTLGTVQDLTKVLWSAITKLETHLGTVMEKDETDTGELCKLTHALSQSASTYLKALEVGELEARVQALEQSTIIRDKAA